MKFSKEMKRKIESKAWFDFFELLENLFNKEQLGISTDKTEFANDTNFTIRQGFILGYCKSLISYNEDNKDFIDKLFFNLLKLDNAVNKIFIDIAQEKIKEVTFTAIIPLLEKWEDFDTHIQQLIQVNKEKKDIWSVLDEKNLKQGNQDE